MRSKQEQKLPYPSLYRNLQEKAEEINLVLLQPTLDLWKLRDLALSDGGLVNDTLRKRAWPKLVGLQKYEQQSRRHDESAGPADPGVKPRRGKNSTFPAVEELVQEQFLDDPQQQQYHQRRTLESTEFDETDPEQVKIEIDTANMMPQVKSISLSSSSATATTAMTSPSSFSMYSRPPATNFASADLLVQSMDVEQIERDVARCTWHLLTGSQRSRRNQIKHKDQSKKVGLLLKRKQRRLANLINLTLVESYAMSRQQQQRPQQDVDENARLRYYQGYHDVACIFMHALGGGQSTPQGMAATPLLSLKPHQDALGLDLAAKVLCQVSFSHFRDNLRNNFVSLQAALKICLYPLLRILDPVVHDHLLDCDMEPFFCLSWILTWFSHDVRDTTLCKRLFDAFLASHPLLVMYVSLAMMLHPYNRQLILQTDCDFAALHQCLTSLPKNSCQVGWKRASWEHGGGYVSDENDDEPPKEAEDDDTDIHFDDATASTEMDMSSILQPPSVQTVPSMTSHETGNSSTNNLYQLGPTTIEEGTEQRVPFQVLIDMALGYMEQYPPRCLERCAGRYYAWQEQQHHKGQHGMGFMMSQTPAPLSTAGISLLQDPPTWSLVSTAPADWVLKQRLRQNLGLKATSRKDRRRKALTPTLSVQEENALKELLVISSPSSAAAAFSSSNANTPDLDYLKKHAADRAIVAAGFGPGPEAALERKRRRQRLAMAVAVGFFAMSVSLALQHYYKASRDRSSSRDMLAAPSSQVSSKALLQRNNMSSSLSSSPTSILSTSSSTPVESTSLTGSSIVVNAVASSVEDHCKHPVSYMFHPSLSTTCASCTHKTIDEDSEKLLPPGTLAIDEGKENMAPKPLDSTNRTTAMVQDTSCTSSDASEGTPELLPTMTKNESNSSPLRTESSLDHSRTGAIHHDRRHGLFGGQLVRVTLQMVRFLLRPVRLFLGQLHLQTERGKVILGNLRLWLNTGIHWD